MYVGGQQNVVFTMLTIYVVKLKREVDTNTNQRQQRT
jgi:hypothetical protein